MMLPGCSSFSRCASILQLRKVAPTFARPVAGAQLRPLATARASAALNHVVDHAMEMPEVVDELLQEQQQQQSEEEMVDIEVTEYTEVEEVVVPRVQQVAQESVSFLSHHNIGKGIVGVAAGLVLFSLALAIKKTMEKKNTPAALRQRQVGQNKMLVDEIDKLLPAKLTPTAYKSLCKKSRYTSVEVFRKYLWYLLQVRKFDQTAVNDMITLKAAGELTDFDVAAALRERAERIYKRYGTLMLNTEGMTAAGIERKATVRNLSSKLLYLSERDLLVDQASEAAKSIDFRTIFGATDEDLERMRIVNLHDQDVDLERLYAAVGGDAFSFTEEDDEEPLPAAEDPLPPSGDAPFTKNPTDPKASS